MSKRQPAKKPYSPPRLTILGPSVGNMEDVRRTVRKVITWSATAREMKRNGGARPRSASQKGRSFQS